MFYRCAQVSCNYSLIHGITTVIVNPDYQDCQYEIANPEVMAAHPVGATDLAFCVIFRYLVPSRQSFSVETLVLLR